MYTFLLVFAISIIFSIKHVFYSENNSEFDTPKALRFFGAVVLSFFIALFSTLIFSSLVGPSTNEWSNPKHISIYSMSSGSETTGNFFLGSGSINEVGVYFYYRKSGRGFIKKHINSDGTIIIQDGSKSPRIEWREEIIKKNHTLSNWVIPTGNKSNYIIYVPKNSIKRKFNFN